MGCCTAKQQKVSSPAPTIGGVKVKQSNPYAIKTKSGLPVKASAFIMKKLGVISENYQFLEHLGKGAFSEVMLARHKVTGIIRAVKKVHKFSLSAEQLDSKSMLKEIQVLKTLDHPNIIRLYEIFEDSRAFYLVMEYCEGGELFKTILQMRIFNETLAASLMSQVLSAVGYCHSKNIIHRDIKPENILVENQQGQIVIKVADFGSSFILNQNRQSYGKVGSAYYIAPEVLNNVYNEKCDLWSCGVLMYILLTGKAPYPGRNEQEILQVVRRTPLQVPRRQLAQISDAAYDLLEGLLCIDPEKRLSARQALEHEWFALNNEVNNAVHLDQAL